MGCLMEKFLRKNSGSKVVNAASIEILELKDAELDTIAGGDALDGLNLLSHAPTDVPYPLPRQIAWVRVSITSHACSGGSHPDNCRLARKLAGGTAG
jgi:hypothetical protein